MQGTSGRERPTVAAIADYSWNRIADMLGRRWAMTSECCVFIVGAIVQITSTHQWAQFAVGRLISGLGIGALSAAVPMVSRRVAIVCQIL